MGTLSATELAQLRQRLAAGQGEVNYDKLQVNLALQAIEDWFEANRAALGAAIDAATTPLVLTVAQKKRLVAFWMLQKFGREGVS